MFFRQVSSGMLFFSFKKKKTFFIFSKWHDLKRRVEKCSREVQKEEEEEEEKEEEEKEGLSVNIAQAGA